MDRRYVLVICALGFAAVTGMMLAVIGATHHDDHMGNRIMAVSIALMQLSAFGALGVWVFGRGTTMIRAYRLGYRQGRRDANAKLLEDGFWLSEKAEADARAVDEDTNGGTELF